MSTSPLILSRSFASRARALGMDVRLGPECAETPSESRPFVHLFGWFGASMRNLSKYAAWYQERGFECSFSIAPPLAVVWPSRRLMREYAASVLRALSEELYVKGRPLVFHCLSNGGTFVYEQILELTRPGQPFESLAPRIAAIVFDCAPCDLLLSTMGRAMVAGAGLNPVPYLVAAAGLAVLAADLFLNGRREQYLRNLRSAPAGRRELYLVSDQDEFCNCDVVEALVVERRERGADASVARWATGRHVALLKDQSEGYGARLAEFLEPLSPRAPAAKAREGYDALEEPLLAAAAARRRSSRGLRSKAEGARRPSAAAAAASAATAAKGERRASAATAAKGERRASAATAAKGERRASAATAAKGARRATAGALAAGARRVSAAGVRRSSAMPVAAGCA
eukprot:tig00021098_g18172.t1